MKPLLFAIAATALTTLSPTLAEARKGGVSGWYEELQFVAPTAMNGVSLCLLVKKSHIFYLPYWTEAKGYGLARNNCDVEEFFGLSSADLASYQANGIISPTVSRTPTLPAQARVMNYGFMGLGGALALAAFSARRRLGGAERQQKKTLALQNAMIEVMCAMALADGDVDQNELRVMAAIVQTITGRTITLKEVMQKFQQVNTSIDFHQMEAVFSHEEHELLLEAAIRIASADGRVDDSEYEFMHDMMTAFNIGDVQMQRITERLSRVATNTPTTTDYRVQSGHPVPAE